MYKKIILGAALFCAISTVGIAQANAPVSIDGSYSCSITDLTQSKTPSTGKFALKANGDIYSIIQLNNDGNPAAVNEYHIFGMRSGDVLSLTYQNVKDAKEFGLEVMKISKDGKTLHGSFIYWDQFKKLNYEVCKRI